MHTPTLAPAPWFRHRWPWLLMLGPAVVVVASSVSAWLAITRPDALVDGDYYKRGKAINQDLRRTHEAQARAIAADISYDAAAGRLTGTVRDARGPLSERLVARLVHPTLPSKDVQLAVTSGAEGRFSVSLPLLERARWQIVLEDRAGQWRREASWSWPEQTHVQLHDADTAAAD
jgi:hypothetical protein